MKNTFGTSVAVTIFGESHGAMIGAVLDGLAPGIEVDEALYENALDNRAYYNTRFRDSLERIELIHGKAEEYEVKREDNIFYFFNLIFF